MNATIIKRAMFLLSIIFFAFALRYFGFFEYLNLAHLQASTHHIESYVQANYFVAVLLYILFIALAGASAIPITALLTVAGGYFFGPWLGALYAALGATLGGVLVFLLVRNVIGDLIQKKYAHQLVKVNKEIDAYGHWYLMIAQISPMSPTPLMNVLAGLTQLSLWQFIWADFIGLLPGSLVYTLAGERLHHIESLNDIVSWPFFLMLILLTLMVLVPVIWNRLRK